MQYTWGTNDCSCHTVELEENLDTERTLLYNAGVYERT